jgi:hypothetical protein
MGQLAALTITRPARGTVVGEIVPTGRQALGHSARQPAPEARSRVPARAAQLKEYLAHPEGRQWSSARSGPASPPAAEASPEDLTAPSSDARLAPEVLEPIRRQLGVSNRVLDVLVAEPSL